MCERRTHGRQAFGYACPPDDGLGLFTFFLLLKVSSKSFDAAAASTTLIFSWRWCLAHLGCCSVIHMMAFEENLFGTQWTFFFFWLDFGLVW